MKHLVRAIGLLFLAGLVAGCASTESATLADTDEPHAVLSWNTGGKASGLYGVRFHRIGEQATPSERNNIPVKPGKYVVRVSPDFSSMSRNETTRLRGNRVPDFDELVRELTVEVEADTRYFIGAKFEGPTLYDWKPVVVREEALDRRTVRR